MANGSAAYHQHETLTVQKSELLFTGELQTFTIAAKDPPTTIEDCRVIIQRLENENCEMVVSDHNGTKVL